LFQVLEKILQRLSTTELLNYSALVSKLWSDTSNLICCQRQVALRSVPSLSWESESYQEKILRVFENTVILPWSACSLLPHDYRFKQQFLQHFGQNIQKLTTQEDANLLGLLEFSPNLRELHIRFREASNYQADVSPIFGSDPRVNLPMLKRLSLELGKGNIGLLESIVRGTRLEFIHAVIRGENSEKHFEKIAALLTVIPYISLEFVYCPTSPLFQKFSQKELRIRELVVEFVEPDCQYIVNYFGNLEEFLSKAVHLLTLKLACELHSQKIIPPFHIPPLLSLNYFRFQLKRSVYYNRNSPPSLTFISSLFSRVTTNDFPVLKKVVLSYEDDYNARSIAVLRYGGAHYDSVKELKVRRLWEDWARIFPNLRSLTATVTEDMLLYVFTHMSELEHLSVYIESMKRIQMKPNERKDDSLNSLLSGVLHPELVFMESPDVIARLRQTHGLASLHSMKSRQAWVIFKINLIYNPHFYYPPRTQEFKNTRGLGTLLNRLWHLPLLAGNASLGFLMPLPLWT